jgi:hypothetical protein
MVQGSGRYKACDSGATEKPCGGTGLEDSPSSPFSLSNSFLQNRCSAFDVGCSMFFVEDEDERWICDPVFASIAPYILFKLDACRNRRHARW